MYKLMLVDDEEDVREGVTREIDWLAHGFEIVGKAENGKEAMELIERLAPDVVVTDIRMPFMDGLELSEWVKDKYPTTKIIILSGFDEFEYAQKAVKLHVDEYVLKPFSAQELVQILLKVKARIDEEIAQKENVEVLKEHYRKSLPLLREMFLTSLVSRKLTRTEIEEKSAHYNVNLKGNGFVASAISIDRGAVDDGERKDADVQQSVSLKDSGDSELMLFAVFNIAEEIASKHELGKVFIHNDHVVLLTVSEKKERDDVIGRTLHVLEEIRQSVIKYLKFTVTAGVGTFINDITDISFSYKDAVLALDYKLVHGNNRVICIDDVETRFVEKVRFDELKEHALIRSIKVGTVDEVKRIVDELFAGIVEGNVSYKDYQLYFMEILTSIMKAAKNANVDLDELLGENNLPYAEIFKFNNVQEAKKWINGICLKIMNHIASDRQYTYKHLVEQAIAYTKAHYQDSDISVNKVCSHLHISAGYFSNIFKKEVKMTFVNYLLHIRMEAAKELLRTTDLKTFEIAEKVGYAEPNYFSFSFRKYVGVSPKEYRNSVGRAGL